MRVLLLQSYIGRSGKIGNVFPLGLSYIATALSKSNHIVKLCDLNLYEEPFSKIDIIMQEFDPEIVGISLRNIDTTDRFDFHYYYHFLGETLQKIKQTKHNVPIMIGGAGFSLFARQIMERHQQLDFGIYLEGDESTPELLDNLHDPANVKGIFYRKNGTVIFTGQHHFPDVECLSAPKRHFANVDQYDIPLGIGVQSKRGCVFNCAYCSYPVLNGNKLRIRPATEVVNEIARLTSEFGTKEIIFTDSVFNIPLEHAVSICNEIIKRKIKIKWSAWFDLINLTDEFVEIAKKSGCYRICLSPDGATEQALASLKKNHSEDDIWRVFRIARKFPDIDFRLSMICTQPSMKFSDVLKTARIIFAAHVLHRNSRCLVSWIRILPDTEIYDIALKEGSINYEVDLLPTDVNKISNLFYRPPKTGWYGTLVFAFIVIICSIARFLIYGAWEKSHRTLMV